MPGSWFFLAFFIIETFNGGIEKKKNNPLFYITVFTTLCVFVLVLYIGALGTNAPTEGLGLIAFLGIGAFALGLSVFLYYLLAFKSFRLRKRMNEEIYKKGLLLLGLSGIFISTNAFGRILSIIIVDPTIYPILSLVINAFLDIIYLIGYIFFYLGVTIPMKKS